VKYTIYGVCLCFPLSGAPRVGGATVARNPNDSAAYFGRLLAARHASPALAAEARWMVCDLFMIANVNLYAHGYAYA